MTSMIFFIWYEIKVNFECEYFDKVKWLIFSRPFTNLVNDRGGGWRMCILGLCRVTFVRTCTRARQQLTYVAMAILRKRSQFMI